MEGRGFGVIHSGRITLFYEPICGSKISPSPFNTQIAIGSIRSRRKKVSLKALVILIGTEIARMEIGFFLP